MEFGYDAFGFGVSADPRFSVANSDCGDRWFDYFDLVESFWWFPAVFTYIDDFEHFLKRCFIRKTH